MGKSNILISGVILSSAIFSCEDRSQEDIKPNVLFIAVDDLRDWVGYLDGYKGKVHTPNIDRLASKGVAFSNAHAASTVYCPSRNSLLSGKRASTTGLYINDQWWKAVYPDMVMLPQYFRENGYYSAGAGKIFHHAPGNNPPCSWDEYQEQVFDDPWNFARWTAETFFLHYGYRGPVESFPDWHPLNSIHPYSHELDWGSIPGKSEGEYGDVQAYNYARDFLQRDHLKPFFLAIGIYRPHLPWYAPKSYFDMYPLDEIILPDIKEDDLMDIPEAGRSLAAGGSRDFNNIRDEGKWREAIQGYLASISFADMQVGAILDALERSEFNNNTIVVFWSDHGWHLGEKGKWHKQSLWEVCTRIPFIIKAPGVTAPNTVCDKPVDHMNVFPTLLSLCDLPMKAGLDGHDMTILLKDPDAEWDYPAISEIREGHMAVRSQNWRYIRYNDGSEELYDRNNDPNEWVNLAGDGQYQNIIDQHRKWIPDKFHESVPGKADFFFDPYAYTWLHRETRDFIDGKY